MPIVSLDHLTLFELTPPELVEVAATAGFDAQIANVERTRTGSHH